MIRCLTALALTAALATAAPVPKAPPAPAPKTSASLTLATAKVSGQMIQVTQTVSTITYVVVPLVRVVNGQNVTVMTQEPKMQQVTQTYQMALKGIKASTADGKEVGEDDLAKKLGDGGPVVQVPANMDPEWKKLFADDVIFLEPPVMSGPGRFPNGGQAILPALPPGQVEIIPLPPPPVLVPVEKK
ncbi:MAG: hypothetical protein ACOVT5_01620 [Armatimonadaceae bacterium]